MEGLSIRLRHVLFASAQVWMRSRNCSWQASISISCCAEIYSIAIATLLTDLPVETILADAFFIYQLVDHHVHSIPASLLFCFCRRAIACYNYAAVWILTETSCD